MQKQTTKQDLRKFTVNFFKSFGATISEEKDVLQVKNPPQKFETFVGKKGPYKLVFNPKDQTAQTELITPGGFFLNAMSRFLSSRSKKTLLKLKEDIKPQQIISERFTFHNAQVEKVKVHAIYNTIYRFTFSTTFQYRNGKKQETHPIYLKDKKQIKLNFSDHHFEETNKKLAKIGTLQEEYDLAKKELKEIIAKKTASISKDLKPLLEKEIKRVKLHYLQQLEDAEEEVNNLNKQIKDLQKKLLTSKDEEKNKLKKRIELLQKNLNQCVKENRVEKLKKERDFVIEDEKFKHGLNVTNKLINTSIIFIPHYTFDTTLKSNYGKTKVKIEFDPLQKYASPLTTDYLKKQTYNVYICAAGKVCLKEELQKCIEDTKLYSKSQMQTICNHCKKPVFVNNAQRCSTSGKWYSKSYIKIDGITNKPVYVNLLKKCPSSGIYTTEKNFIKCPNCKTKVIQQGLKRKFEDRDIKVYCNCCKGN